MNARRKRLDVAMVERELAPTRARAQALIMARRVTVDGVLADKAGHSVADEETIAVTEPEHPWVGRGGMKLDHALRHFEIDLHGLVCLDIGASTGGFTDVMLTRGAARVYAIDVGYGQLDQKLRDDPRVVSREKVNARHLVADDFDEAIDFVSIDVSFISLRLILPVVPPLLAKRARLVALIKPQFEVGKGEVGKGGIVRDPALRAEVVDSISRFSTTLGFELHGVIESPVQGAEGNVEFLLHASIQDAGRRSK